MKWSLLPLLIIVTLGTHSYAQLPQFNLQVDEKTQHFGQANGLIQDQQGYIWFSSFVKGLVRYDGKTYKTFRHDPENSNSPASNFIISMALDPYGKIWLSPVGSGLDRFDPVTNSFTHFRHNKADPKSIISDTVFSVMIDHSGKPWMATNKGLETFDAKSNSFIHIPKIVQEKSANISASVFLVYEDKKGIIWFSTSDLSNGKPKNGMLFRLDRVTGKQTFYKADPLNPDCLIDPFVSSIFEDSKGNFWVGTGGNGLHTLDRETGKFTRLLFDPAQPGKLSTPVNKNDTSDAITFISEDYAGKIWIGSFGNGLNWYDPKEQHTYHFGIPKSKKNISTFEKDTLTGFKDEGAIRMLIAADSSTWITGLSGNIYTVSYGKKTIPYYPNKKAVNAFYLEPNGHILWFGTDSGLVRKDLVATTLKYWKHDPKNSNSLNHNSVVAIQPDENGKLYIGAHQGGLDLLDPETGKFAHIKPVNATPGNTLDSIHTIFIENKQYLWLGGENGLARVDRNTNYFKVYRFNDGDKKGISGNTVYSITKDKNNHLWFANFGGLDKFIGDSNYFKHYLNGYIVKAVLTDAKGMLWVGTESGLFQYNEAKDQFFPFNSPSFPTGIESILNILEDDQHTLWITTANAILKINANRERVQMFNADYGIFSSNWNWLNNYKARDGRLFIGGHKGYYMFNPEEINVSSPAPVLNFAQLIIGGKEILPNVDGILKEPIWKTAIINLAFNQNSFSIDFVALNFNSSEAIKYSYQLENFDNGWNNLETEHKSSFFNVPPGRYMLRVRAINSEGSVTEKAITIIISPPWWKTWWAYSLYALLFILLGYLIYKYQKYYIVKKERERTQQKELAQAKEIEKAYTELKATQAQLIQSEKMASLGELTAGIAHEIQNPLNFVNNFSEVNTELIEELKSEKLKVKNERDEQLENELLNDIAENEKKINHHGKRADAIVKGMLQHSRSSSGQKEPININALADEYLRLAYQGLRAKDKSFNASLETNYDKTIELINIIPQDIGRVLLNLYNNAFYAVNEKQKAESLKPKAEDKAYEPRVTITTRRLGSPSGDGGKISISVQDNGNGIPQKIMDKIFQPFFTTKPTGQGTGLGLSLAYDIVKAHGGEIKVETKNSEGTTFIINLPITHV